MSQFAPPQNSSAVCLAVERWRDGRPSRCLDWVADEVPVALEYNGISHAVMMASPYDLEDFGLGFSLSEGLLADRSELYECDVTDSAHGIQVRMRISEQRFVELKARRRSMAGRTGCGLCGVESLQQAVRRPATVGAGAPVSVASIYAAFDAMQSGQRIQHATGATHAAAWLDARGNLCALREDVGRHNALDKMIGALAAARTDFSAGAALITSRASFEMVQKVATVGIGVLAAISAPTRLAVQLAKDAEVSLIGFVRNRGHVVYAGAQRLIAPDQIDAPIACE